MKKYFFAMTLVLGIFYIAGCSKNGVEVGGAVETTGGVEIYEEDRSVTFDLNTLPYDMEYKGHIIQYSSCELYQEKSDINGSYTPYLIAKVKTAGIDDETLHLFDQDIYVYGKIFNDKNQLNNKELTKIREIDKGDYRYYVFSLSLSSSDDYKYDFSESAFNVTFLIHQGEDDRALKYVYNGYSSLNVEDLKDLGEDNWNEIKRK
ncbi:hypothetical protein [Lacrimispora sp. JR3]|uniref:hypothetical protein n=1 Tax=Lacrimispora sinapis TaxID=3111456 RepID=UPI003747E42E